MRVAALYDVHGNLPALEAVLDQVHASAVDLVVVGGDVIPGPMPSESLALLRELDRPVQFIMGNGDREVLAERAGKPSTAIPEAFREVMRWNAAQISPEDAEFIAAWPAHFSLEIDQLGDVLFCHATPQSDNTIFTRQTHDKRLEAMFEGIAEPMVVCGHTHMQFDLHVGGVWVVNAGSVGMPFGEPGAYWLMLGPEVNLIRTAYDVHRAAQRIAATQYPQASAFAASNVVHPPTERAMLEAYARIEPS